MPRRRSRTRFRPQRSRSRLERFLQRCCFICMNAPNEYPSKRLPCCSQFIHEECLLRSFQYSSRTNLHYTCPPLSKVHFILQPFRRHSSWPLSISFWFFSLSTFSTSPSFTWWVFRLFWDTTRQRFFQIWSAFVFNSSCSYPTCGLGRISSISLLVVYSLVLYQGMLIHTVWFSEFTMRVFFSLYINIQTHKKTNKDKNKKKGIGVAHMEFIFSTPFLLN